MSSSGFPTQCSASSKLVSSFVQVASDSQQNRKLRCSCCFVESMTGGADTEIGRPGSQHSAESSHMGPHSMLRAFGFEDGHLSAGAVGLIHAHTQEAKGHFALRKSPDKEPLESSLNADQVHKLQCPTAWAVRWEKKTLVLGFRYLGKPIYPYTGLSTRNLANPKR